MAVQVGESGAEQYLTLLKDSYVPEVDEIELFVMFSDAG